MNTANVCQYKLTGMNIELTTKCQLRCPQCYCTLEGGRDIQLDTAVKYLREARQLGLKLVNLSGGETLCYPYLYELVEEARGLDVEANIAISGVGFDESVLEKLKAVGVSSISVSLNAPTEETNRLTRAGFDYSIAALELLKERKFCTTHINWVMHSNCADSLPQMIELAEKYDIDSIDIIAPKPTSRNEADTIPTREQMEITADIVHRARPSVLQIESCFSPLLALVCDTKLFGNLNVGPYKGCGAGRNTMSINVDGVFSPCRHLEYYEKWDSLIDYWNKSEVISKIRTLDEKREEPCASCYFSNYCRHCLATNAALNGRLYIGFAQCPIASPA